MRILDYEQVLEELKRITEEGNFQKQPSVKTKLDGIELPYYTLGMGENHIVVVGGTHGSEIISVDFVLRLMEAISKKKGIYTNIDLESEKGYTFHFLPLHNPEGYIVSTSVLRTKIPRDISQEELEKVAKEYFLAYRQDDINAKKNPEDKSQKLHQAMFNDATYECIPETFQGLRKSIKEIYESDLVPKGSIVVHRGTGSGVETNRSMLSYALSEVTESEYAGNRYNNILRDIPGPLGTIPEEELIENKFLKDLLERLYQEEKYCGMLTYHGTGGMIYSKLSDDDERLVDDELPEAYLEEKYQSQVINRILTRKYHDDTRYIVPDGSEKPGYRMVQVPSLKDVDETLRMQYPAVLLIELSYMGGNPIGPLGDKQNNYLPTMEHNLIAAYNFFKTTRYLKDAMYGKKTLIDEQISEEMDVKGHVR